jgi:predicted negative regulator of RcsB-dependent stress response
LKRIIYLTILSVSILTTLNAQKSIRFTDKNYWLHEAEKQIQVGLYNQAENSLKLFFDKRKTSVLDYETQWAKYLQLLSALNLQRYDADHNLKLFLNNTPFDLIKERGHFLLARYYFSKNNFELAIPSFEKSGIDFLTNEEISIRNFELGYAYLASQKLEKAAPLFASVKGIPGSYFTPGNYYHGIYCYYNKNYDEALTSFKLSEIDPQFKSVIPFYYTEINYLKGNKEQALVDAKKALDGGKSIYYQNELNQLAGQIYFEQDDFKNAELYFNKYIASCESPRKEDYFRLGFVQYQQAKFNEATTSFNLMYKGNDLISQKAYYFLANCYLSSNKKDNAYNAFVSCSEINNDLKLKEIALFHIAKLSYENKEDLLAEKQLSNFLTQFPTSQYSSEAMELLAYLNIKNDRFDDAMIAMNTMKSISSPLKKMYQRANYARGIQMLLDENSEKALNYFDESNRYKIDPIIASLTTFWQSETMYRMGRFEEALEFADFFLNNTNGQALQDYQSKAHLLKLYVYFQNEDKENLNKEFALIADANASSPEKFLGSAKPNFIPENTPLVENDPYVLIYNLPEEKTNFKYTPIPLKPIAFNNASTTNKMDNYCKLGIGNVSTYNLEIGYDFSKIALLPLYVDYRSTSSSTERIKFQRYSQSHLGAKTERKVGQYLVNAQVAFDRNKQYYYGYDHQKFDYTNTDIKQVFSNFGIQVQGKDILKKDKQVNYFPNTYLGIYTDKFGASELNATADLPLAFEKNINNLSTFSVGANINLNAYQVKNLGTQNNSMLILKPSFTKKYKDAIIKVGLYPVIAQKFHLLPDVTLAYPVGKYGAQLLAGLQSCIRLNTFKEITTHNPYIFNNYNIKQSKNTELYAGISGSYLKNVSYSSKIGVADYRNLPVFINDTSLDNKQFIVGFESNAQGLIFEGSANYTFNSNFLAGFDLSLKPILKTVSGQKTWGYRPNTLDIYAKVKASNDIILKADLLIRSGSSVIEKDVLAKTAYSKTLAGAIDVNIGVNYFINKKWNMYIDVNNLFNNSYRRWYGYENFGINIQFGLIRTFNSTIK